MGHFYGGVPPWLVAWIAEQTPIQRAVETGTYAGESAAVLADRIGSCISIEIDADLATKAAERFRNRKDIEIIHGDSRSELPRICSEFDSAALYWLDGHWSGFETGGESSPCPVMEEIAALHATEAGLRSVIAIDDARLFGMSHGDDPTMQHWPRLSAVLTALEQFGSQAFLVDDIIVAVPAPLVASFLTLHSEPSIRQRLNLGRLWSTVERADSRRRRVNGWRSRARRIRAMLDQSAQDK